MSRIRAICLAIAVIGVVTVLSGWPFTSITPKVEAQAQAQLVPLVTDQTPLGLSSSFGVPLSAVVNQAGDYAFVGNGASAVFYRRAGTAASVRVMQMGDEVPGFPGSRNDITNTLRLNNSGLIAFRPDFFQANGTGQGAIFTFDGTSLQLLVSGADLAPGGGGAKFERNINLLGVNDSGAVAFTAPLTPSGSVLQQTTLYIVPAGGAPIRVVGVGDAAPGTGGTVGSFTPLSFNNRGEALIAVNILGGSGGSGLFVGDLTGVRKVVANGDANPLGGTFPSVLTGILNNAGEVAFPASGGLWTNTPANVTTRRVNVGDAAPAPVGGTFGSPLLQAFDDAGDIAFLVPISGSAVSNQGLFRFRPASPVEVVAYRNQAAAGAPGESFNTFAAVSINSTGVVSFQSSLLGGSIPSGIFQQTGSNPPVKIALDGQPTSLAGGGTYGVSGPGVSTQMLNNGSVYFRSDIPSGTADYAEFLNSVGTSTVLMSTADTLQTGARVALRTFRVGAAGDFVGFIAQRTGGRSSIAVHNITNQSTTVLVTDGDAAPGTGGGRLRLGIKNTVFLNGSGSVAFSPSIIGGTTPRSTAIFLATVGGGLTKVVIDGDLAPGTGGKTSSSPALNSVTPSPMNVAGQVLFSTILSPGGTRGVFVWSPGSGVAKVAAVGDVISGAALTGLTFDRSINSAGQVAFIATTAAGPGIYIGTPGGPAAKVVAAGDPGPSGSTFSAFHTPGFNDSGEVAFMATLTGGPGGGVFVGSTSGPPVAIALNGAAAPAGGNFSITAARPDVVINNQHDVAFRANLTGGTADSGYFIRRGPLGTLQAPVLQGQAAPGTSGVFDTIAASINSIVSENFQLSPAGDLAFQNAFVVGGQRTGAIWHVKSDNTTEEILVKGNVAPEFGGGSPIISTSSVAWNSGGRYPVWARVSGGTFTDGIFLFVPTASTNTPVGTAVSVTATDSTTGTTPVALTFATVTGAGATSLTTSSGGPAIPTSFALGDPPVFYNIETTATFSGAIGVCIDFSSVSFAPGSTLRLLHFEGGAWVDVTTSGPSGNLICGSVNSLSPFTVVRQLNRAPVANAGSDQIVECTSGSGCTFTLNGSGSTDPDHDTLSYVWKNGSGAVVGSSANLTLTRALGTYTFTLTVKDPFYLGSTANTHVTVRDTIAPTLTVAMSPNSIWPPNNKMVQVTASIMVSDACDPHPLIQLVSITCNETLAAGDVQGATLNTDDRSFQLKATRAGGGAADDVQGATLNTDDPSFQSKATRAGGGAGRIYTITYRARDAAGNTRLKSAQVVVPHDQGH
jgi:hypothetical protein